MLLAALDPFGKSPRDDIRSMVEHCSATAITVMSVHLPHERQDLFVGSAIFASSVVTLGAVHAHVRNRLTASTRLHSFLTGCSMRTVL